MANYASGVDRSMLFPSDVPRFTRQIILSRCSCGYGLTSHRLALYRTGLSFAMSVLIASLGCVGVGTSLTARRDTQSTPGQPDIDPLRAYVSLSRIEPAVARPERPESLRPLSERASRQIAKADKLVDEQRYTEAAIELERALRYDPNHPKIHRTLAMLHWHAGNLERAKIHIAHTMEGNPDDAVVHYLSGRCHALVGDHAAAIAAYRTALLCSDFNRDPEIAALCHYQLAEALAAEGYLEASLTEYVAFEDKAAAIVAAASQPELVTLLQSNRGSAGEAKATILKRLGRFTEAAKALAPLVAASKDDVALGSRYATLWMRAGRLNKALAAARAVRSDDVEIIELLAEIHKRAGHPERIVDDLRSRITDRPDEPSLVLNLADMLTRLGQHEEARRELQDYVDKHPGAHGVRARLADMHIAQSAWNDALRVCAEAIDHHPNQAAECEVKITALAANKKALQHLLMPRSRKESASAAYLRGLVAAADNQWEHAEAFLRQAYAAVPESVPARVALTRVYLLTYRYDEALEIAGRTDADSPEDPRLELVLGRVYERLDNVDKAELHFKAAIQLDRANTQAMLELAKLYGRSGRRLQAQRQLRVLLDKDPDHETARELLATTYFEERKLDVAIEEFEELQRRATTPTTKTRCKALLDQRRQPDADAYRQALIEAMERHGPDAATWIAVAESHNINVAPEKKREAFEHALTVDPENEEAMLGLIETSRHLLAFEEAAERLKAMLPRRPNRHAWCLGLIELYRTTQDYEAALNLAESMEARDDLDDARRPLYRLAIVDTLRLVGRTEEALARLKAWADVESEPQEWSIQLAEAYIREDQASEAVIIYEAVHGSKPADRDVLRSLVRALIAADRHDRAAQYVLDWLNDDPENDNAVWALAIVLRGAEKVDAALELVRNRLLHTFERQQYQDLMVDLLIQARRYDECIDLTEVLIDEAIAKIRTVHEPQGGQRGQPLGDEAVVRLPDEPFTMDGLHRRVVDLRQRLALVLILAEDYQAAERQLTLWLDASRDPGERFGLLQRLALCHRAQGDESQANMVLARALLLRPDDVTLNNDVAYGWIDRGIRLEEAEPMIRYALSRSPRQSAYLDTYGWLLYKKGGFEEAKKWLLRASRARADGDPVILDHLGDACWQMGASDEAIEHWTAAVEAVQTRPEAEFISVDERRVRESTQEKIDNARAGRTPAVAPLASPPSDDGESETGKPGR